MIDKCKHHLVYNDTISATTSMAIYDHGEGEYLSCNNEYGYRIKENVTCINCGMKWNINKSSPKFIKEFMVKINELRNKI